MDFKRRNQTTHGKTVVDTTSVVNASSETNTFTPETAEPVSAFDYNETDIVPVSRTDAGTFLPQGLTETNPSLLQSIPHPNVENKGNVGGKEETMEQDRLKLIEEGRRRDEAIFELIYTLIGNNTPESDRVLEEMRQKPGLKWYVEQAEAGIRTYIEALRIIQEDCAPVDSQDTTGTTTTSNTDSHRNSSNPQK